MTVELHYSFLTLTPHDLGWDIARPGSTVAKYLKRSGYSEVFEKH
jgi:hypothetical protein